MARKPAQEKAVALPLNQSTLFPIEFLDLDSNNPRLQTGSDRATNGEVELITTLADISALDEIVTSICTNTYLNLEPMIVIAIGQSGRYRVLEGNRRLAAIKALLNPTLAKAAGIKVPSSISSSVLSSVKKVLVYRVAKEEDARAFIGFKHINGPQRWDAYAKAKYVTDWYKKSGGKESIDTIADKMGDNNNTLRAYIFSVLMLEQAESKNLWTIKDRYNNSARFAFSHLYTAIGRKEYQEFLGMPDQWSDKPPLAPIKRAKLEKLGEVLGYIYGSRSEGKPALVRSQNPDLKDLGFALVSKPALDILRNNGSLDDARDASKEPGEAFHDSIVAADIRLTRSIRLMTKYEGGREDTDQLINEVFEKADTLKTMTEKKKARRDR